MDMVKFKKNNMTFNLKNIIYDSIFIVVILSSSLFLFGRIGYGYMWDDGLRHDSYDVTDEGDVTFYWTHWLIKLELMDIDL